jgi:hypothetical protein
MFESDMFTESTLSSAMKKVQELVRLSGFCSVIGDVTSYLFKFLQSRGEFESLAKSCRNIADICSDVRAERPPVVEFYRIEVSNDAISAAGFHEIITGITQPASRRAGDGSRPPKSIEDVEKSLIQLGLSKFDSRTGLVEFPPKSFEIMKVEEIGEEIEMLKASTFFTDIIRSPKSEWDEVFVERTIYETEFPLPHPTPFVPIIKVDMVKFTRIEYYKTRLEGFSMKFKNMFESLEAVFPADKMIERWGDCPLKINTHPLLVEIGHIAEATLQDPIYYFVSQEHVENGEKLDKVPDELRKLSDEIWEMLANSITFIHTIQSGKAKNPPTIPGDNELLARYTAIFDMGSSFTGQDARPAFP